MDSQKIYDAVTQHYSHISSGPSRIPYSKSVAQSFGYTEEELDSIPNESNLGLSCGNPLAIASLQEGETIIDLGSGAGFDVFLAAKKVGRSGRAIGIDMNQVRAEQNRSYARENTDYSLYDMISLAEINKTKIGATNVEFLQSLITSMPLADGIADAVISNCVINLVPEAEKQLVFNEMFRLLKPGGRVALSDILAKAPLPNKMRESVVAYCGCIAGASLVSQYEAYLKRAGFKDVLVKDSNSDINVYTNTLPDGTKRDSDATTIDTKGQSCSCAAAPVAQGSPDGISEEVAIGCCGSKSSKSSEWDMATQLGDVDLNEWVGSYKIFALKPEQNSRD